MMSDPSRQTLKIPSHIPTNRQSLVKNASIAMQRRFGQEGERKSEITRIEIDGLGKKVEEEGRRHSLVSGIRNGDSQVLMGTFNLESRTSDVVNVSKFVGHQHTYAMGCALPLLEMYVGRYNRRSQQLKKEQEKHINMG